MAAYRIAVFDFDQTLAADEISMWIDRVSMADRGFGGAERVAMLAKMLATIADLRGELHMLRLVTVMGQ